MNDRDQTQLDRQARDIFLRATEMQSAEMRAAYLEGACQQDAALRGRVEELLAAHAKDSVLATATATADAPPTVFDPVIRETAGLLIGRYKLLEQLGEGGFGAVWLAEQKEPVRRKVALKIVKLGMDTKQVVARFEIERQALALMDHPNIAKVFDAGMTDSGLPYFVMELVRGIAITRFCDENRLPARDRLNLFIKVCHAVQHAHQKGIIHRDLKPSNILVTLHDGVPVPKVIDFGIAKATQQELTDKTLHTMFQQFIGTPAYVSPEQAEMSGLDIDTRSDIYSLGVLLYELLTGLTPFDGRELIASGIDQLRRTIREKEPMRPSTRFDTLPEAERTTTAARRGTEPAHLIGLLRGDLDWIVMKCLEKDRQRRYDTATGLARDIERHLNNEPVTACPPSIAYRLGKFVRRNWATVGALTAIVAVALAGGTVSAWQAHRARRAASDALRAAQRETSARLAAESAGARANAAEQKAVASLTLAEENALQAGRLLYDADVNLAHKAL